MTSIKCRFKGFLANYLFGRIMFVLSIFIFLVAFQIDTTASSIPSPGIASNDILNPAPPLISGIVWEDMDGDGQQGGEPAISGVDVDLLDSGSGFLQTTTTDGTGAYSFEDLAPGDYIIRFNLNGTYEYTAFQQGPGSTDSDANPASNGESDVLTLGAGASILDIDAGFYIPAIIGNEVWEDLNGNGIQDGNGPGIGGVPVTLSGTTGDGTAVNTTQNTNAGGFYQFTDVVPGTYTLNFNPGGAYIGTEMDAGGDDSVDSDADAISGDTDPFDVVSDDNLQDWDAGFFLPATVSDYVWEDLNANGVQDGNGPGIDGVPVTIDGTTGAGNPYNDNTNTAGGGFYIFDDVPPGNYTLNFGTLAGYEPTVKDNGGDAVDSDADETSGDTDPFDLISDEVNDQMDAGFYQFATIGDYVWEDLNGNGIQDGNGPGVDGADVNLIGTTGAGVGVNENTTTGGGGIYQFVDVIPGNYTLTFSIPAGYDEFSRQDQAADDIDSDPVPGTGQTAAFDVESADDIEDYDAAVYRYVTIGDYTWEDLNGNGNQDAGEPEVRNVPVSALRTSDGVVFNTVSDAVGFYEFVDLKPDEYTLTFGGPGGGFVLTFQNITTPDLDSDPDPTSGVTAAFTLESGEQEETIDAGYFLPCEIGNYCWRDSNTDGIQDAGENGFQSIDVNLSGTTGHGQIVNLTSTTDAAGEYFFVDLPPGEYQVEFITPASYTESPFQAGGDQSIDSDAPISDILILESGDDDKTIDGGFFVEPPDDCDQQPANECPETEVLCDIEDIHDFCTVMLDQWNPGVPNPLCPGGGFAHNPSWFAFVAASETVTLIIHASDCSVGGGQQIGIQYGIYEACGPPWESVICQPNCELPGDITVTSDNFVPGEDYFFFIDGCNGTICTYWIEIVEGGGYYEVTDPTEIICDEDDGDCNNVCLGANVEFTLDECDNAVDYVWTIDGVIDGNLLDQVVNIQFLEEGTYEICGYGENVCDQSETVCITVTVAAEPDVDLGPFEVCANVLADPGFEPPDWEGGVINAPGEYTVEVENEFGCFFNQLVEIVELPNQMAVVDTLACHDDIVSYLGEDYVFNVEDEPLIDFGGSPNGCDKFVNFSVTFLDVPFSSFEDPVCLGSSVFELSVFELVFDPLDAIVSVQWYLQSEPIGGPLTNFPYVIQVTEEGLYTAVVTLTLDYMVCEFEIDDYIEIVYEDLIPPEPEQNDWIYAYCNNIHDTLAYSIFNPNFDNTYVWTYPNDVAYAYYDEAAGVLFIDWFGSAGGEICVQAINDCGESTVYCEDITISFGPDAAFNAPDTLCLTDLTEINYTGGANVDATYTWGFSGGVDTSGNNDQGAGPYVLTWNSVGPKVITLTVEENGCVSSMEQTTVFLQPPLQEPFINCLSNQSEITFSWDSILNASGYDVTLIQGTAGTLTGTDYYVSGLDPLDSVSIVVTALSDSYCPPTESDTITCYALDCPPVTLDIFLEDTSICYSGGGAPFILDHLIDPIGIGDLSWSGTGIIDTETGLFHPDSAGFGSHAIRISYVVDNCTFNDQAVINIYETPTAEFTISSDSLCNTDDLIINYIGNSPSGNATWEFDDPSTINGQDLEQHIANWQTGGWKSITLMVEQNGCESEVESKMVFIEEALPEIDINCESSVDSVVFTWPQNDQIEGYQIYVNGSIVDSLNVNTFTVDGLTEGDQVEFYLVGINKGICANSEGGQDCEAEACPEFSLDITPNLDSICLVDGISPIQYNPNLTGATEPGVAIWSGNGIDENTGMFDPTTAGVGTHQLSYEYAEGSCDIDTSFTITVMEQPETDFVIDQSKICVTDFVTISTNNFNSDFNYHWNTGSADIQQISDDVMEASWSSAGTYDISLYVSNAMCESGLVTYQVEVEPLLTAPILSCDPSTQEIVLEWNDVDCASAYQVYVDGTLVTETSGIEYTITDLDPGQQVDIEIVVLSECSCPNIQTTLQCQTDDCEAIELSIENLIEVCENEAAEFLTLEASVVGTQGGTFNWSGNNISMNGDDGIVELSQLPPGEHFYTVSYDLDNCHYEFTDALTIYPEVNLDPQGIDPSCHDMQDGSIQLTALGGTAPFSYFVNGVQFDTTFIDQLPAGDFNIELIDDNNCQVSGSLSLVNPQLVIPDISGLELLQENQQAAYTLSFANAPSDAIYTWYLASGDTLCSDANCTTVELSIEAETDVCVDVSYNGGLCLESDCLTIRFEEIVDVYIPNVFSPNNDDKNDKFYIKADESVTLVKSMSVFDRWGELIYQNGNFVPNESEVGWDGTFNGNKVLPGVYVYDIVIVTKENKEFRYSGDITLIR